MNESLKDYLASIGAEAIDPKTLRDYEGKMEKQVIPRILREVRNRQRLVVEAKQKMAVAPEAGPTRKR